jgi:hypothetical protein
MSPIVETASSAAVATLLTNLFKLAWPSAPGWALVMVALLVGVGASLLVGVAGGAQLTPQVLAGLVLQGTIAAGGAAGLDSASQAAAAKRASAT